MRLCIIQPDGSSAEVLLNDNHPSLETVNNDILLFETIYISLLLEVKNRLTV